MTQERAGPRQDAIYVSDLYLHRQGLDTTTPSGKAIFGMLGVFEEFRRAMIQERVKARMASEGLGQVHGPAEDRCRGRAVHPGGPEGWPGHHLDGEGAWCRCQCRAAVKAQLASEFS